MKNRDRVLRRRELACQMAADIMAANPPAEGYAPTVWSLATFFEAYMCYGSDDTKKYFGPKPPKKARVLKLVRK